MPSVTACIQLHSHPVHLQAHRTAGAEKPAAETWEAADFPAECPKEYQLSHVQYRHFRAMLLGKPVQGRWLTDDQLTSEGCASWKQYMLHISLGNYG